MKVIAKTFAGLEEVLANEIKEIGGLNIKSEKRAVWFECDKKLLYAANYTLRTALKILAPIAEFQFKNVEDFYKKIYEVDWENYFVEEKTIFIDKVVYSQMFKNTQFAALKTKDAIVDRFKDKTGNRPSVDLKNPQIKINLYVKDDFCSLALDSSGNPLYKRSYRVKSHPAQINEVLAAGLVLLSEWDKKTELLDFMCGSGTIPIEAALIGLNIPPQFKRKKFAFQNWKDYDKELWESVIEEQMNKQSLELIKIFASDISQESVDMAAENIANAGLSGYITIRRSNFENVKFNSPKHILFNPPYGKRIGNTKEDNILELYKKIGDVLKNNFKKSQAWLITSNMQALKNVGLKTSKKIILYNGPLESRFVKYDLY